jgi:hypothetical protein
LSSGREDQIDYTTAYNIPQTSIFGPGAVLPPEMGKSLYLERYCYGPQEINTPPHPELKLVVVIPCYDEPDLKHTLQSLNRCLPINGKSK